MSTPSSVKRKLERDPELAPKIKELKYFFRHDYKNLPPESQELQECYNYYNENHTNKVSYALFLDYIPKIKQKMLEKELKYFFLHDYQKLPLSGWGLKEYYNYYNEHHTNKVSFSLFSQYFPTIDFLVLY